jgi:hypothetical protein
MRRGADGRVIARNRIVAKVSAPRVAEQFLSPPPADILQALVVRGQLSAEEASAAALMPIAEAVTGEGQPAATGASAIRSASPGRSSIANYAWRWSSALTWA